MGRRRGRLKAKGRLGSSRGGGGEGMEIGSRGGGAMMAEVVGVDVLLPV